MIANKPSKWNNLPIVHKFSYSRVFSFVGRKNPNNCPIHGTFFIDHEYTNYQMVQQLHYDGHEIGTYSLR